MNIKRHIKMKMFISLIATIILSLNLSAQNQDISTYIPEDIADENLIWLTAQIIEGEQGNGFTWQDNSGNDNNAAQNPGLSPVFVENGINGQPAVDFSNNNPNIVLEIDSDGINNTDDYKTRSIAILMKTSAETDGTQIIYTEGDKKTDSGLSIYIYNHKLYAGIWNEEDNAFTSGVEIATETSYLLTLVYNYEDQKLELYLNGITATQTTSDFVYNGLNGGQISLGGISNGFETYTHTGQEGNSFQGMISELALFNIALTEEQINDLSDGIGSPYGHGSSTLPVDMLYSNAETVNGNVVITWTTASEINNDFFTIERSNDLINWNAIGTVSGAGNSKTETEYEYTDFTTLSGTTYYRIVQTDFDGTSETFDAMSVNGNDAKVKNIEIENTIHTGNSMNVRFTTESTEPVNVKVYSLSGTLLGETTVYPHAGINETRLPISAGNAIGITKLSQNGTFTSSKTILR
jgi:hypothetical protein